MSKNSAFAAYAPTEWDLEKVVRTPVEYTEKKVIEKLHSVTRSHGISSSYKLYKPSDQINDNKKNPLDQVLIQYRIGRSKYNIFTVKDFFTEEYDWTEKHESNIRGYISERVSQQIIRAFLKRQKGQSGGLLNNKIPAHKKDNLTVKSSSDYILKTMNYPNMLILRQTGQGKYGYQPSKELDGLFDYTIKKQKHLFVLETKVGHLDIDVDQVIKHMGVPLNHLFPDAYLNYVIFTNAETLFENNNSRFNLVSEWPKHIYQSLQSAGINPILFTFNETPKDFRKMKTHIITQYNAFLKKQTVYKNCTVIVGEDEKDYAIFSGGETPLIKIQRQKGNNYKRLKLSHKNKK